MSSLLETILNEPELICSQNWIFFKYCDLTRNIFICTPLNGFKYYNLTVVILLNIIHFFFFFAYSKMVSSFAI